MPYRRLLFASIACVGLAGCGSPGQPQPPSLQLPKPVSDFRAARIGDTVIFQWTSPTETTDGVNLQAIGASRVCRSAQIGEMQRCGGPIGTVTVAPGARADFEYSLELPADSPVVMYAVEALNSRGRSAGLSNQVAIPLAASMPPFENAQIRAKENAVILSWRSAPVASAPQTAYRFRVERRDASDTQTEAAQIATVPAGEQPAGGFTASDTRFEWEHAYEYAIIPEGITAGMIFQAAKPARIVFTPHDSFPPAVPRDIQAVATPPQDAAGAPVVHLTWSPNLDDDLAGYNIYRRVADGSWLKLNRELIPSPAFRDDRDLRAGDRYTYAVSAVDLRGNESQRSAEASETVP